VGGFFFRKKELPPLQRPDISKDGPAENKSGSADSRKGEKGRELAERRKGGDLLDMKRRTGIQENKRVRRTIKRIQELIEVCQQTREGEKQRFCGKTKEVEKTLRL